MSVVYVQREDSLKAQIVQMPRERDSTVGNKYQNLIIAGYVYMCVIDDLFLLPKQSTVSILHRNPSKARTLSGLQISPY